MNKRLLVPLEARQHIAGVNTLIFCSRTIVERNGLGTTDLNRSISIVYPTVCAAIADVEKEGQVTYYLRSLLLLRTSMTRATCYTPFQQRRG
ncbi:hypothetical protein FKM82_013981 [Ascaphus truei]